MNDDGRPPSNGDGAAGVDESIGAIELEVLRNEVQKGFDDLDDGRHTDISAEELSAYLAKLSNEAARRVAERR